MNPSPFDTIARCFANRRLSRRQALAQGGAGLAAAGLAGTAQAQEATPAPTWEKIEYLFVQSFQSGSIAPKAGEDGAYTLTLEGGLGQTIYFSDRPERIVGAAPTQTFLDGLGFSAENPPNAALVIEPAPGETDVAVVELYNPAYDEGTHTATYDVKLLAEWERTLGLALAEAPADLATLHPEFGAAHLFIDDCANSTVFCWNSWKFFVNNFTDVPMCWNYGVCMPCEPYGNTQPNTCATFEYWNDRCNSQYEACNGGCYNSGPPGYGAWC